MQEYRFNVRSSHDRMLYESEHFSDQVFQQTRTTKHFNLQSNSSEIQSGITNSHYFSRLTICVSRGDVVNNIACCFPFAAFLHFQNLRKNVLNVFFQLLPCLQSSIQDLFSIGFHLKETIVAQNNNYLGSLAHLRPIIFQLRKDNLNFWWFSRDMTLLFSPL